MKKGIIAALSILVALAALAPGAAAISMDVDDAPAKVSILLYQDTSYVPIRAASQLMDDNAQVSWVNREAVVKTDALTLTARPGKPYLAANGRMLYIKDGVKLVNGTTMVPIRELCKAFGATVAWDQEQKKVIVRRGSGSIQPAEQYYDSAAVYWLSRIINAESATEPFRGKIAVGNVILNRVKSPLFPYSIYHVIFDTKWGVQFEPTRNGSINNMPNEDSVIAAKLCLDGASVAADSLYFLNTAKARSLWILQNCSYVMTIGNHQFYS